ncbi:MAG: acetyl-CoA carboxylase biotin carboxyl carrier protein subunit [Candidatus Cyclobacteriaceae bacterium M2_1C_046]
MYQVLINEKVKKEITFEEEEILVDNQKLDWDLQKVNENEYHLLYKNKSYRVEIRKEEEKTYSVKINGKKVTASVKDKLDLLLAKLGLDAGDTGKLQSIKAPMPGLIVDIKVKEGDVVEKGDMLLILEAMKMENVIKSPGEGTVKSVNVKKGDGVEKNQVMIQF